MNNSLKETVSADKACMNRANEDEFTKPSQTVETLCAIRIKMVGKHYETDWQNSSIAIK